MCEMSKESKDGCCKGGGQDLGWLKKSGSAKSWESGKRV